MDEFATALSRLSGQLFTLLLDPVSNLAAALVLYAIIGTALAIVLVIAIMVLMGMPDDDHVDVDVDVPAGDSSASADADGDFEEPAGEEPPSPSRPKQPFLVLLVFGLATTAVVWLVAGYTTSTPAVCAGCHLETPHTAVEAATDPHSGVSCVACHEPGGYLGRYVTGVPFRTAHFVNALFDGVTPGEYGRVTQSACSACHRADIASTIFNEERGLRMSHIEPLEAAATCLDCHVLQDGVVASHNAGMNPCMRCHDAETASSECGTCHDRDAAMAVRVRTGSMASVQIPEVRCGGCHNEQRDCDPCHGGTRLPHSSEFMAYAHARAAAVDFWYNDGQACAMCHTPDRRPCSRCHTPMLGVAHPPDIARSHQDADPQGCAACHPAPAQAPDRDFCLDVCHTQAAIRESPR